MPVLQPHLLRPFNLKVVQPSRSNGSRLLRPLMTPRLTGFVTLRQRLVSVPLQLQPVLITPTKGIVRRGTVMVGVLGIRTNVLITTEPTKRLVKAVTLVAVGKQHLAPVQQPTLRVQIRITPTEVLVRLMRTRQIAMSLMTIMVGVRGKADVLGQAEQ